MCTIPDPSFPVRNTESDPRLHVLYTMYVIQKQNTSMEGVRPLAITLWVLATPVISLGLLVAQFVKL